MTDLPRNPGHWTYDPSTGAYYFAPDDRTSPPYTQQREVMAIIDIGRDGTLAGIELIGPGIPPPKFVQRS